MKFLTIDHKLHSLYTFAAFQIGFESNSKFNATLKYMKQAYGPGIHHDREKSHFPYSRNTGDNKIWYYSINTAARKYYRIYLTTPEQLTMVGLLFN